MNGPRSITAAPQMAMQPHLSTIPLSGQRLSVEEVERACSIAHGVVTVALGQPHPHPGDSGTGGRGAAFARHIAMYLAHVGFGLSMAKIGRAFGRDRTTVVHACHVIEDRRDEARFDAMIDYLEQSAAALLAANRLHGQR